MTVILDMDSDMRIGTLDPVINGRLDLRRKLWQHGDQEAPVRVGSVRKHWRALDGS